MKFSSGSGQSSADKWFLVHSELKIMFSVIVLWRKFSNNHVCIVIRIGPVTMVFLRKKGLVVWFRVSQGVPADTIPLPALVETAIDADLHC